ncbi:hypothetical protein [Bradyrhizobium sp. STM 3562]|uniref:hypothetical protein n=1 Tax=Bradyrhizobium sp. STM 3562 TaxID=578924 RepID=UPI0038911386
MVARYHLLQEGRRQYLSLHMSADLPDAQGLFIERMDHALCAIGPATVAFIPHREILKDQRLDRLPGAAAGRNRPVGRSLQIGGRPFG